MLLAIDAGNTNLVFALVDGGEIKARWRIATDPRRTADQYAVWLHQLLELEGYRSERRRRGDHRHRRPARAPQSRSAREQIFPCRAADRRAGRGGVADRARRRRAAERRRRPRAQRDRRARQAPGRPDRRSISAPRRRSTWSTSSAPTRAGSSRRGSTCRSTRWSTPRPSCRGSRSRRPRTTSVIGRTTESQMLIGIYWGYVAMIEGLVERHEGARSAGRSRWSRPAGSRSCSTSTPRCSTRSSPT